MGHQLTALANGGETIKLKYGHRGGNQPVKELKTGRVYVTSQNHGYAVVGDSIDPSIGIMSHWNANDKTCEGVEYKIHRYLQCSSIRKPAVVQEIPAICLIGLWI